MYFVNYNKSFGKTSGSQTKKKLGIMQWINVSIKNERADPYHLHGNFTQGAYIDTRLHTQKDVCFENEIGNYWNSEKNSSSKPDLECPIAWRGSRRYMSCGSSAKSSGRPTVYACSMSVITRVCVCVWGGGYQDLRKENMQKVCCVAYRNCHI